MLYIYTAIFTPIEDGTGYYAKVPDLPGCISTGSDLADAISQITDALNAWLVVAEDEELDISLLTDEDKEEGYIGYFMPEDESGAVAVMYVDVNGMSLEEYAEILTSEAGATEVEVGTVNGLPCVSYQLPEQDSVSVTFTTEAGYVLEVTCAPLSEENAELVWGAVVSSIQGA